MEVLELEQQKEQSTSLRNKMAEKTEPKLETKKEIIEDIEKSGVSEKQAKAEEKLDEKEQKPGKETGKGKKEEPKKAEKKKETKKKVKREMVYVYGKEIPISTKKSQGICRFIKGKRIGDAIRDLEEVANMKRAVAMKGEVPHRKGKMAGGQFPQKTAKHFIVLLRSLAGNASEMDNPVIVEAISNFASRPFGRFGRVTHKRTNIKIIAKEKKIKMKKEKKNGRK